MDQNEIKYDKNEQNWTKEQSISKLHKVGQSGSKWDKTRQMRTIWEISDLVGQLE